MLKRIKLPKELFKYCVAAILIIVPLYPKFPFIRVPGTFVSIRIEDLILAFAGLIIFIDTVPRFKSFVKAQLNQSVILFLLTGLVSYLSSVLITKTVVTHIGLLHWLRRIEYFIPLFLGYIAVRKKAGAVDYYFKLILIVVFVAFLYGIGQRYFGWPIIITQNEEYSKGVALRWIPGSHINSTFAGHYDLSTFLVLVLPIIVSALFLLKGAKTKVVLFIVTISGLWLLVNSASRISLVSYLGATTIALFLIEKYKEIPIVIIASIAFIGLSSNLLSRYARLLEVALTKARQIEIINLDRRLVPRDVLASSGEDFLIPKQSTLPSPTPIPRFEDRSTNIRLNVEWPRALRALSKNPLLGTGYSSITLATDNDYLRMLGEIGILGFIAFLLILIQVVKILLGAYPFRKNFRGLRLAIVVGVTAALPGIFLNAVFIDVFEASKFATLFWMLVGMTLAMAQKANYEKDN